MEQAPLVYIVILNYNNYRLTYECVESLVKLSYARYKIVVVDDFSKEKDINQITHDFDQVTLIKNEKNLNYCKSFNVGIRHALKSAADYVFLINNDTKDFSANYLEEIIGAFEKDEKLGMVGSKCIDYVGGIRRDENASVRFGINMDTPTEGYVIKREVFDEIGLLNEWLVIYMEDLDFIARLRNAGFRTKIVPEVSFAHLGGGTTSKVVYKSNYYRVRNIILFTRKYCSHQTFVWRLNEIKGNLRIHVVRIIKNLFKAKLLTSLKILAALILGLIVGSFASLENVWNKNNFN